VYIYSTYCNLTNTSAGKGTLFYIKDLTTVNGKNESFLESQIVSFFFSEHSLQVGEQLDFSCASKDASVVQQDLAHDDACSYYTGSTMPEHHVITCKLINIQR